MPLALLAVVIFVLPALAMVLAPLAIAEAILRFTSNPFIFFPNANWLWRVMFLLGVTHAVWALYLLSTWISDRASHWVITPDAAFPGAVLTCLIGALLAEQNLLSMANAYLGRPYMIDAVMGRSDMSCTTSRMVSRVGAGRTSRSCALYTYFDTGDGKLLVRSPLGALANMRFSVGTPVRLVGCKSLLGFSLVKVGYADAPREMPLLGFANPASAAASQAQAVPCLKRKTEPQRLERHPANHAAPAEPSVMDAWRE
ncbi:hypothetical protein [Achromobacter kerstersii]